MQRSLNKVLDRMGDKVKQEKQKHRHAIIKFGCRLFCFPYKCPRKGEATRRLIKAGGSQQL